MLDTRDFIIWSLGLWWKPPSKDPREFLLIIPNIRNTPCWPPGAYHTQVGLHVHEIVCIQSWHFMCIYRGSYMNIMILLSLMKITLMQYTGWKIISGNPHVLETGGMLSEVPCVSVATVIFPKISVPWSPLLLAKLKFVLLYLCLVLELYLFFKNRA